MDDGHEPCLCWELVESRRSGGGNAVEMDWSCSG